VWPYADPVILASTYSTTSKGPFSAVRPAELRETVQEPVESSGPEPVDEVVPISAGGQAARRGSAQGLADQAARSAGAALSAFPQVVHVLANPEFHLGQQISHETGLPVVSLQEVAVDDLEDLLTQPEYAEGFILEGFPKDRSSAEALDGLLSATGPTERRVLSFEHQNESQREIVDHYIDQGLLWMVPATPNQNPEQLKSTLLECLAGLPALE
jgi:hypothetical protein